MISLSRAISKRSMSAIDFLDIRRTPDAPLDRARGRRPSCLAFMKRIMMLRYILDRLPYIGRLRKQIRDAGIYPAGHYYSPIPEHEEIVVYLESKKADKVDPPAIDLNRQNQF